MADFEGEEMCAHFELENSPGKYITLALFTEVTNCHELRQGAIDGNIEGALLKPSMIVDPFQVVLATHKAVHNKMLDRLKTRTLYSEVIFNLSPTTNITDSFKKFGLADGDNALLIAIVTDGKSAEVSNIKDKVQGRLVPIGNLSSLTNQQAIKKAYKIQETELTTGSLSDAVIFRMATKDAL